VHCLGPALKQGTKNSEKNRREKRGAPKSARPVAYAASAIWLIRHCGDCDVGHGGQQSLEGGLHKDMWGRGGGGEKGDSKRVSSEFDNS
jgi:hypothetical protein